MRWPSARPADRRPPSKINRRHRDDNRSPLMRQEFDRLYTFQELAGDPRMLQLMERWSTVTRHWDEPKMDPVLVAQVEAAR